MIDHPIVSVPIQLPKPAEVEIVDGDAYSYYLSIWDTEESLHERSRNTFMTIQLAILTVSILFFETLKGLSVYMVLIACAFFYTWIEDAIRKTKQIAFLKWLIIEHEKNGHTTRQVFTKMRTLGKKCEYDDRLLTKDKDFKRLISETRSLDIKVCVSLFLVWSMLLTASLDSPENTKIFSNFVLDLFS